MEVEDIYIYIYIYTTCTVQNTCACLVVPSGSLPVLSRSVVSYLYHFLQCCNMYMQQLHTHLVSRDRKYTHTPLRNAQLVQ